MRIYYLEIVTGDVDAVCAGYAAANGVPFGEPDATLGHARTAPLAGGGLVGVRAPLRDTEESVVRPYWLVDDIEAALGAAVKAPAARSRTRRSNCPATARSPSTSREACTMGSGSDSASAVPATIDDSAIPRRPVAVDGILADTAAMGFGMASEPKVGALLAVLAASKPGGRLLELGTGTGHGTAWLLAGMDAAAMLDTVDTDANVVAVAQRHLGADARVRFHVMDGATFLQQPSADGYDLIYADAWPGKFTHLDEALALLRPGGSYVIDDLLPQPSWPEGHAPKVPALIADLERRTGFRTVQLAWASGLMIVVRTA